MVSKNNKAQDSLDEHSKIECTVKPPDGGYGWVIVFAAMLCNLVCDGTLFAFGAMKIHLQEHFQCSEMLILMVGSVPCGVYLLVGPIVSGLANRYGCRKIIIIGSIGAATSMALSTLSPNAWVMMVIYGIFGGIFFGMIYLPSVVMVSFYFDKKRAVANGLVTAGTGIGVFTFGPLSNFVMNQFGWRGGLFVLTGIMLTCILFGAAMKPLQRQKKATTRTETQPKNSNKMTSKQLTHSLSSDVTSGEITKPLLSKYNVANQINDQITVLNTNSSYITNSTAKLPSSTTLPLLTSSSSSFDNGEHDHIGIRNPHINVSTLDQKPAQFTASKPQNGVSHASLHNNTCTSPPSDIPAMTNETIKKHSTRATFLGTLATMINFSILENKQMLLICIGNIFSMLGYYLPILCLVSFAIEDNSVNQTQAVFLLTIFGFFNTIGRLAGGPITMIPHFSALRVHNTLLFVSGILTVLLAYAYDFKTCAIYAALYGFAIAPHMSLLPGIICDSVGLERYTEAFGILFLFRGVTSIIGPPVGGFLKDYTKRYDLAFVVGGSMIIIAAFFHFSLPLVKSKRVKEENDA